MASIETAQNLINAFQASEIARDGVTLAALKRARAPFYNLVDQAATATGADAMIIERTAKAGDVQALAALLG